MEKKFKFELGQIVDIKGGVKGAAIVSRCYWETVSHPEGTNVDEIRSVGDRTVSVCEAEIIAVE